MTTPPTSAQKIPVPPIRHLTSIMVRNGAPAFAPPAPWEPNLFRVVNQSNRERNGLDVLTYDPAEPGRNGKLWVPRPGLLPQLASSFQSPAPSGPLVILDCENDNDPWDPRVFATMEAERAHIAANFPHVVVVPFLGHARELLRPGYSVYNALQHVDQLRDFVSPFKKRVAPCIYFDPDDDQDTPTEQARMLRLWRKIIPGVELWPCVWHFNKVARHPCTSAEWKCQLDACAGPNVKGIVWWGDSNGLDHSGGSSDPRTLSTFATSLLLPSSPIHP